MYEYSLILVAIICATFAWVYNKRAPLYKLSRQFPGPLALPLLGSSHYLIGRKPAYIMRTLMQWAAKYGNTYCIWLGPELHITMHELRDMERVLSSTQLITKSREYELARNWLGEGLLLSTGRKWQQRRKLLTPAFHFKMLEQLIPVVQRQVAIMLNQIRKRYNVGGISSPPVDLFEVLSLCTLDVICESAMGISKNAQVNAESDYVKAVRSIKDVIYKRSYDIFYHIDLTYRFTKLAQDEKKALQVLHGFTEQVIMERRQELLKLQKQKDQNSKRVENNYNYDGKERLSFLDILLQSKIDDQPLSDLDIREEVDTFVFEGHDTTATGLNFFFYNIATHPSCQNKCLNEILEVFGESFGAESMSYEKLNKLTYIECCIKETLRMFPPITVLGRHVTKDCSINDKLLPAGTTIGISPFLLGRDEKLFPQAKQFIPQRFNDSDKNTANINRFAYIPFSAGPRNCIGQKYALIEMKCIVVHLLYNFEIEFAGDPNEEMVFMGESILRTEKPLLFNIKPRLINKN